MTIGVGFLGCGPAAQAIHIPTISVFPDELHVAGFMDIDLELAGRLAAQHGGLATTDEDALINDPSVDVIVVGSPNAHHARQIIKACKAGKCAVLAEKPLAVSKEEVDSVIAAARESGTRIIVGSMHAYDRGYVDALAAWRELGEVPTDIEVTAFGSGNDRMVDSATQLVRSATPVGAPNPNLPDVLAMTAGTLSMASHDIPLVRDLLPEAPLLIAATRQRPAGYALQGVSGSCGISFIGLLPVQWHASWTLRAVSPNAVLEVDFAPSYVLATGCTARLTVDGVTRTWHSDEAAYVSEWRALLAEIDGAPTVRDLDRIAADLEYALNLVGQLGELVDGGAR